MFSKHDEEPPMQHESTNWWKQKRVLVTGGAGFLGRHVVDELTRQGCSDIVVPRSGEFDLREKEAIVRLLDKARPAVLIHLAAVVGGIGANRKHPGSFFYDNAVMGIQLMEWARRFRVEKFVCSGTVCAYPNSQPDGQPRRCLDTGRAEREFGFKAKTTLRDGLKRTIDWYEAVSTGHGLFRSA
jgi:nucleoside-diphosphate-sugar epimerase